LVKGGYVLTCWHVVDGAQAISISIGGKDLVAQIIQKDPADDIAVLKVDTVDSGVFLHFPDRVKLGEQIFTRGFFHPELQGSDVKFTGAY
jgi:serine protease Do